MNVEVDHRPGHRTVFVIRCRLSTAAAILGMKPATLQKRVQRGQDVLKHVQRRVYE